NSVSFPPLGCGNGGLSWADVRPLMERYLKGLSINVFIHDRQVPIGFLPEHSTGSKACPKDFDEFVADVRAMIFANRGRFHTLNGAGEFSLTVDEDGQIKISRKDKTEKLTSEVLEEAWSALQNGLLTNDQYSSESVRRYKSYIDRK